MTLSGFFFNETYKRLITLEGSVQKLQTETAVITSNRFSSTSWLEQKTILDNERLVLDRRIIILEQNNGFIRESLTRIENLISEHIKDKTYGSSTN